MDGTVILFFMLIFWDPFLYTCAACCFLTPFVVYTALFTYIVRWGGNISFHVWCEAEIWTTDSRLWKEVRDDFITLVTWMVCNLQTRNYSEEQLLWNLFTVNLPVQLTHCSPMFHFYIPENIRKPKIFVHNVKMFTWIILKND